MLTQSHCLFAVLVVLYCSLFERNHDDALFSRRFTSEPGDKSIDYSVAYKYNRLFVLIPLHDIHSRSILRFSFVSNEDSFSYTPSVGYRLGCQLGGAGLRL